jgi:hypothetical protein
LTARLGVFLLGLLAALGLAEGVLRVAAVLDPRVRVLATGRATRTTGDYQTLEEFIAAQAAYITPRRPWYNRWSNAFGFHDTEFVEPKPAGRLRVLAVGDSFTFALVPYPQGVMTLTEESLRAACGGRDLDLLNMGVIGAEPREYRMLVELGARRFSADLVLVNLFVGNDPPDIHRHVHDRSPIERALRRSYTWTAGKNFLRSRAALRDARLAPRLTMPPPGAVPSRGGALVAGATDLTADDPALVGPGLSDTAYHRVLMFDLGRFYHPGNEESVRAAWAPLLAELDSLHRAATQAGSRVALALLPSILQVDAPLRAATVARAGATWRYRGMSTADIDPGLPNRRVGEFARARGIPLVDLTALFVTENGAADGGLLYKRNDNHWTPRGNRVAGRALAAFLAPLLCSR